MRTEPPKGDELDRMLADIKGRVQDAAAHTPAARRTRIDRIVGAVVAAVLALGLGSAGAAFAFGILPQTPTEPEPASIASPAATAPPARTFPVETAPPAPVDPGPTPRIGLTCDDLVDTAALVAFLGDSGTPVLGPVSQIADTDELYMSTPDRAAAEQLGALTCVWSNGVAAGSGQPWSGEPLRQAVSLAVLPEGLDAAARYVDAYQSADPTYGDHVQGPRCVTEIGYCELFGVVGSTWVELRIDGIVQTGSSVEDLRARFRNVTDPLVSRLSDVSIAEPWTPASSSPSAAAECATIAPTDAIMPLTGVADLRVAEFWDGPRIGQYWYAKDQVGADRCLLQLPMSDRHLGSIGVLPNGAWAFERYAAGWSASDAVSVGLPAANGGTALSRCEDDTRDCRIDFVVGDDWVSVGVPPKRIDGDELTDEVEMTRSNIVQIGTIVAERIAALSK
ncbi:hypothetical protein ACWEOH_14155 [Agromyces sp. NPDC004153]